jgi:hypothetical protein
MAANAIQLKIRFLVCRQLASFRQMAKNNQWIWSRGKPFFLYAFFRDRTFDSSVDRGMPKLAEAPVGPDT